MSGHTQEPPRRSLEGEQTVNGRHSYPNQTYDNVYGGNATANGAHGTGSYSGAPIVDSDTYYDSHARA